MSNFKPSDPLWENGFQTGLSCGMELKGEEEKVTQYKCGLGFTGFIEKLEPTIVKEFISPTVVDHMTLEQAADFIYEIVSVGDFDSIERFVNDEEAGVNIRQEEGCLTLVVKSSELQTGSALVYHYRLGSYESTALYQAIVMTPNFVDYTEDNAPRFNYRSKVSKYPVAIPCIFINALNNCPVHYVKNKIWFLYDTSFKEDVGGYSLYPINSGYADLKAPTNLLSFVFLKDISSDWLLKLVNSPEQAVIKDDKIGTVFATSTTDHYRLLFYKFTLATDTTKYCYVGIIHNLSVWIVNKGNMGGLLGDV